jgi:DNA-binding transcriptional regulator GbsR (MarR family)
MLKRIWNWIGEKVSALVSKLREFLAECKKTLEEKTEGPDIVSQLSQLVSQIRDLKDSMDEPSAVLPSEAEFTEAL